MFERVKGITIWMLTNQTVPEHFRRSAGDPRFAPLFPETPETGLSAKFDTNTLP